MIETRDLIRYCDDLLDAASFRDYSPNGLQVEGRPRIERLVAGVTASLALVEAAATAKADALLVHHGWFWKGEPAVITGIRQRRIRTLLEAGINLIAYHLPLDAHPELGNNAGLGRLLGVTPLDGFGPGDGPAIGMAGEFVAPVEPASLASLLSEGLGRQPLWIDAGTGKIRRIGWCTGAAQGYIEVAAAHGLDAFVSGEISEQTVHLARELGIHYFAAGHHATERFGPDALGRHLAGRFDLDYRFIDIDNPV